MGRRPSTHFVPEAEQRSWRLLPRTRVQHTREITRLRNRIEGLLEECRIKVSGLLSDLLGTSGRRMRRALIAGKTTDPQQLAGLADKRLRAAVFPSAIPGPYQGEIFLDGQLAGRAVFTAPGVERHGLSLPPGRTGLATLGFRVPYLWRPAELIPGSEDDRLVGLAVCSIGLG